MDTTNLTPYIVDKLSKNVAPRDIIYELCEKANLTWPEAEKLVNRVRQENSGTIERRQMPLKVAMAVVIFLAGLGLLGYGVFTIVSTVSALPVAATGASQLEQNIDATANLYNSFFTIVALCGKPLIYSIFGLGMVLGSLIGMRDIWSELLFK